MTEETRARFTIGQNLKGEIEDLIIMEGMFTH